MADPTGPNTSPNPDEQRDYEDIQFYSRQLGAQYRRLFQNRPQSWRYVLRQICSIHFTLLGSRLVADIMVRGPRATRLNVLSGVATAIAIATRLTWHALFANPYSFMGYRRPGVQYRRAVYLVSLLTTIPTLVLHVALIQAASEVRAPLNYDYGQTILTTAVLLVAIAMYSWMVRRFLLKQNDEHYEPTLPPNLLASGESPNYQDEDPVTGPTPSGSSLTTRSQPESGSPLLKAYTEQKTRRRARNTTHLQTQPADSITTSGTGTPSAAAVSEAMANPPEPHQPHRCQTLAWFDYIPESRLSDPLIVLLLMLSSASITWPLYLLIQENAVSKFPSSQAKSSLYAPLGALLICVFAQKRFLRTRFFARIITPPPYPWVMISQFSPRPCFRNSEDGSIVQGNGDRDPRFRVPINVNGVDYITLYNMTATGCDEYWGHRGRQHSKHFRIRTIMQRFLFLVLACLVFAKGIYALFAYRVPVPGDDDFDTHPGLTLGDVERQIGIAKLKLKLMVGSGILAIFILFYSLAWASRLLMSFAVARFRYGPVQQRQPDREIQLYGFISYTYLS